MALSKPREIAEQFYALIPRSVPLPTLAQYGLEGSTDQAQLITKEMLSLNLYWIYSALTAHLAARHAERVFRELQAIIEATWDAELLLGDHDVRAYWVEMEKRRKAYDDLMRRGGTPPSLYLEAAASLESAQAVQADDRQRLLALFIDLIPEEAIGEIATEIELSDLSDR